MRRPSAVRRGRFTISTDPARLDPVAIHAYLSRHSYWAKGRSLEVVRRSLEHSLGFGLFDGPRQIGLARVVTDQATYAWVADVYVLPRYRGQGLAVWLMETVMADPRLQGLRRMQLATRDAHGLYRKVGFEAPRNPERMMERRDPLTRRGRAR